MKAAYLIKRIARLDYRAFFQNVRIVRERTGRSFVRVLCSMVWCGLRYGAGYKDYTVLRFYDLSARQRRTYLTRTKSNELVRRLNGRTHWEVFDDKVQFLHTFAPFVGRAWLCLSDTDTAGLAEFLKDRPAAIAKPLRESGGVGIEKLTPPYDAPALYARLCAEKKLLVEAFIEQHAEVAAIYAGAVNTLRLTTIVTDGAVEFLFAGLRVGNGGIIDNISNGGMVAKVDLETGRVISPAIDKAGDAYERHPATDAAILGFTVPRFFEAKEMIRKAALMAGDIRYVGWDVVILPQGVELLEGNQYPGHEIMQISAYLTPEKEGILPRLTKYFTQK